MLRITFFQLCFLTISSLLCCSTVLRAEDVDDSYPMPKLGKITEVTELQSDFALEITFAEDVDFEPQKQLDLYRQNHRFGAVEVVKIDGQKVTAKFKASTIKDQNFRQPLVGDNVFFDALPDILIELHKPDSKIDVAELAKIYSKADLKLGIVRLLTHGQARANPYGQKDEKTGLPEYPFAGCIVTKQIMEFETTYNAAVLKAASPPRLSRQSSFKIENGKVYWEGWNAGVGEFARLVKGADASTFEILKNKSYAKDANSCFYQTRQIAGAEPSTFVSLGGHCAKDKNHAYQGASKIRDSQGSSFELISGRWSKDKDNCFCGIETVKGADPATFRAIGGYLSSWAADKNAYYYNTKPVPTKHLKSFKVLTYGFAKDETSVFYGTKIVEGADPVTFEMVADTAIGKDANSYYRFGKKMTPNPSWLKTYGQTESQLEK